MVSEGTRQSWTVKTLSILLSECPRNVLIFCLPKCGSCYIGTALKLFIIQLYGTYLVQGTLFSNKYRILKQIQCYRMASKTVSQFSSVAQSCLTLCDPMNRSTPGLPVHHQFLESNQTHVHVLLMPSNHLILCCPLLLLSSIFPRIRVFSNESALRIRWSKYWNFSFNISLSNEHPGWISFRMDWLDLLTIQGTFKTLLQHHS